VIRLFFRRLRKNERGAAMLEFAIVVPFLLLLILGIIEFGWVFNGWLTVTAAAREGARVAVLEKDNDDDVYAAVQRHVDNSTLSDHSVDPPDRSGDEDIKVIVKGQLLPIIGLFVRGELELTGQATMRREYYIKK
jgi:Flp pilus assembly protein TadG